MYQSIFNRQLDTPRMWPGQEEFTLHVISSRHADEGRLRVLYERQDDPEASRPAPRRLGSALGAALRRVLSRPAGDAMAPARGPVAS